MKSEEFGTLSVVGTPIGNLREMTPRAIETLNAADCILCEDCRHTLGLLNAFGISKPLRAHHKFNERGTVDEIVEALRGGKNFALVTDAGMPCISDPGRILVSACREAGIRVTVVSGPCAAIDALVLSGFDSAHFCFVGFLPERNRERKELLARFADVRATLLFYVPPHSLNEDLAALYRALGARKVCLVREITKLHEEAIPFTLCPEPAFEARGEYVVVAEGAQPKPDERLSLSVEEHLAAVLAEGTDKKEAIKRVASERKLPKNEVYRLTVEKGRE